MADADTDFRLLSFIRFLLLIIPPFCASETKTNRKVFQLFFGLWSNKCMTQPLI